MTTHANPCGPTTDNVGGLVEHVICHVFWFLSIKNPRWRTAAFLNKSKNCRVLETVWQNTTKFGITTHCDPGNYRPLKLELSDGRHFENR